MKYSTYGAHAFSVVSHGSPNVQCALLNCSGCGAELLTCVYMCLTEVSATSMCAFLVTSHIKDAGKL